LNKKLFFVFSIVFVLLASSVFAATVTIRPNRQGKYMGWTNVGCSIGYGEWQCVDEPVADTSDYLQAISTAKETFTFTDINLTNITISKLGMWYYMKRHNYDTNRCFSPLIRSNNTDYLSATPICIFPGYDAWVYRDYNYTTNPATGNQWTVAEVNALEAGMQGTDPDSGGRIAQVYAVITYT